MKIIKNEIEINLYYLMFLNITFNFNNKTHDNTKRFCRGLF